MTNDTISDRSRLPRSYGWAILALAGLFVLLIVPMPTMGRVGNAAADLLHAPCFAILSVILYRTLGRSDGRPQLLFAAGIWVLIGTFGFLTEGVQSVIGRNASLHDALANVAGAGAGVMWGMAGQVRRPALRGMLPLLAAVLLLAGWSYSVLMLFDAFRAGQEFPQLASFEQPFELWRWKPLWARMSRVQAHATDGQWSLQLDLQPGPYPGAGFHLPEADWSHYHQLVLDLVWDDGALADDDDAIGAARQDTAPSGLPLVVKVHDAAHNFEPEDRFHYTVRLEPGRHQIRIPISEIAAAPLGRAMDMQHVAKIEIFTVDPGRPHRLYIDNIRLE